LEEPALRSKAIPSRINCQCLVLLYSTLASTMVCLSGFLYLALRHYTLYSQVVLIHLIVFRRVIHRSSLLTSSNPKVTLHLCVCLSYVHSTKSCCQTFVYPSYLFSSVITSIFTGWFHASHSPSFGTLDNTSDLAHCQTSSGTIHKCRAHKCRALCCTILSLN
jgi:hypothetical protein